MKWIENGCTASISISSIHTNEQIFLIWIHFCSFNFSFESKSDCSILIYCTQRTRSTVHIFSQKHFFRSLSLSSSLQFHFFSVEFDMTYHHRFSYTRKKNQWKEKAKIHHGDLKSCEISFLKLFSKIHEQIAWNEKDIVSMNMHCAWVARIATNAESMQPNCIVYSVNRSSGV